MEFHLACIRIEEPSGAGETAEVYARNVSLSVEPSPFLVTFFQGLRGIKGQIAAKMACDTLCEHASVLWEDDLSSASLPQGMTQGSWIAREAFRSANNQVYRYAHVMGAGGQMGARGLLALIDGSQVHAVRVGGAQGYLAREEMLVPLFKENGSDDEAGKMLRFVGANAQILVDCAKVNIREGDFLLLSSCAIDPLLVQEALRLQEYFSERNDGSDVLSVLLSVKEALRVSETVSLVAMYFG